MILPVRCLVQLTIVIAFSLTVPTGHAQNLTKQWVKSEAKQLVEGRIAEGLSIGFIEGDHWGIVHLGHANGKRKPNNRTIYGVGSISKVYTGLMLADAVVRGEIDLKAEAIVENEAGIEFPTYNGRAITWLDLSTHRAGLPKLPTNILIVDPKDPYQRYDSKRAAAFLSGYRLTREPGEKREYSNFGVSVLGYLVAENAGSTYQQLLNERIAKPLRLTDCTVELTSEQKKRIAIPHKRFGSPTPMWTFADLPGAGGVRASLQDMMRFAKANLEPPAGQIGEAIELAWQQHVPKDSSGPAMGLGWNILWDGQTRWHNGQTGGYHAALFINREARCAAAILCNTAVSDEIDDLAMSMIMKAKGLEAPANSDEDSYPKQSPFAGVRWQNSRPEVFVAQDWYQLVSLNDLPVDRILGFSKKTFGKKWQKRFEEDLVELLSKMGHPPKNKVKLVLKTLDTNEAKTWNSIPMTTANRDAIKSGILPNTNDGGVALANDPKHRRRLAGRYQLAPNFIFTVRDRGGRMMVSITNQPTQEVFPDSPTHWSYRGVDATLEFQLPERGSAKSLILHQNGVEQTAQRIQ